MSLLSPAEKLLTFLFLVRADAEQVVPAAAQEAAEVTVQVLVSVTHVKKHLWCGVQFIHTTLQFYLIGEKIICRILKMNLKADVMLL